MALSPVRKHGGLQADGWSFDFVHLHAKSGSLSPLKHFAHDLRDIVRRQALPGYPLAIERGALGAEQLLFTPIQVDRLQLSVRQGNGKSLSVDTPVDKL